MSTFRMIFIHGYTSSHTADWYPQISEELIKLNVDFAIPDLPGYKHPHAQEWLEVLHNEVIKSNKPLVLVGHSLGTRAALLYLEKYQPKVEKVFLVAAFANRLENADRRDGEAYPDFFEHLIDIEKIRPLVNQFVVLHSKDDASIPYEQGVEIASDLNAKLITFENQNHFVGAKNAEIILQILQKELHF